MSQQNRSHTHTSHGRTFSAFQTAVVNHLPVLELQPGSATLVPFNAAAPGNAIKLVSAPYPGLQVKRSGLYDISFQLAGNFADAPPQGARFQLQLFINGNAAGSTPLTITAPGGEASFKTQLETVLRQELQANDIISLAVVPLTYNIPQFLTIITATLIVSSSRHLH